MEFQGHEWKEEYTYYVKEDLIETYNLSLQEVERLIQHSAFSRLMESDPAFVTHYQPDYWAKQLIERKKKEK